ncbi:sigma 54-interacting transcriptional regulator [Enterococcus sp. ALS3]|uniref:Sigma 54-interacting transcriptional regulator n=1 Tax=Enterococcus alishanensis TaxID=1303817 RepID=A0ABS6TCB9_9ENTE|nr:sigma-54-dependent transcriptional regulator [Enterococcus alishanensis]MBV7390559.1 sigma 54-interacting transcriptional regulator [Enterococcus alishanensis]
MKRIDKVYQKLNEIWYTSDETRLIQEKGSSASELAELLALSRANVSSELNKLVRDEMVVKIKGYPVRYISVEALEEILHIQWPASRNEIENVDEFIVDNQFKFNHKKNRNPFDLLIGHKASLKKAVSQAKAAVHYPPNGLHMLLLGPTGSGKTFFANKIYQYGIYEQLFDVEAPFISFNCADYYNNPQLLMSQLFGYVRGAFTGADEDHPGLVEQANHGVLLLDEVHRLTPEGQEMLFYFIDNGHFNRMGENGFQREAEVLIVCATTEDPNSNLLGTFQRRIPMTIEIPALIHRSIEERVDLIKFLFENEAKRVKKTFYIDIDVISALVQGVNYGNVGQLKSQIQLVCAQAFLKQLHQGNEIKITLQSLPEEVRNQWHSSSQNIKKSEEISSYVDVTTVIYPNKLQESLEEENSGLNIYEVIEDKVNILEKEGISKKDIHQYIMTDLHLYVRNFVNKSTIDYNLLKFVEPKISELTLRLKNIAEAEMGVVFDNRFLYYIGMHLDAYFHRETKDKLLSPFDIIEIKKENASEYQVACLFKTEIENSLEISFPEIEVIYLTMLLVSIETLDEKKKVSVLVVAHGNSTATSMVQVAKDLLGDVPMAALNMPLEVQPEELFAKLVETIKEMNQGRGVLMLVDMGSLATFEEKLIKTTKVPIKTIPNVTTSMVLDVARKTNYMDLDLNGIYHSVTKDFLSAMQLQGLTGGRDKAILAVCTTGQGTAKKLEEMITKVVDSQTDETVRVVTVSSLKMKEDIPNLLEKYQVIASVGTKNPKIDVPYISLENLVDGSGERALRQLLGQYDSSKEVITKENVIIRDLVQDTLNMYLVYLNPHHITDLLMEWIDDLQIKLGRSFPNSLSLKLVVHTAFAFERVLKQSSLDYDEPLREELVDLLALVEETIAPVEEKLDLNISQDEKMFIAEVLLAD